MYNKLKIIIFANLFLTVIFTGIGVGIANEQDNAVKILGDYHIKVNEIVNTKVNQVYDFFDLVVEKIREEDPTILLQVQSNLLPPRELNAETCQENLSSTCLYYLLNEEYQQTANAVIRNFEQLAQIPEGSSATDAASTSELRNEFILSELKNARTATENTVEFYQQFIFALPLHIELKVTAFNLKELKGEIRKFSSTLEDYPSKFHDATTVQCL